MFVPQWLTVRDAVAGQLFGALYRASGLEPQGRSPESDPLMLVAREFSPRIEILGPGDVTLDLSGLSTLFGDARTIGQELRRTAADRLRACAERSHGVESNREGCGTPNRGARVAIAGTRTAARLLARHRAGLTVIEPGTEASALAPLPLSLLNELHPISPVPQRKKSAITTRQSPLETFRRWGLRTLGEFAALPPDEVMARLGVPGIEWQRVARGEDARPLVPAVPEERFEQSLELEWPIEGLEPLSFVLGRLIEPLSAHLAQRDRGAAVLHVRLRLVDKQMHERSLELPAPMREPRTLRTLALLDLESHPPSAAIDRVTVAVDPTPARVVQYSLLTRPLPTPEQLSTLTARLHALMGETRCGAAAPVDSWQPGAFEMKPFSPVDAAAVPAHMPRRHADTEIAHLADVGASVAPSPVTALRRFRRPVAARVHVENGKPARLVIDRRSLSGGRIATCAGPWRTSGAWWLDDELPETRSAKPAARASGAGRWDRDEWDVLLEDGATYRLFRERAGNQWFVEGVVD